MQILTEEEFNQKCDAWSWHKLSHLTDDEKIRDYASRASIGIYIPSKQELHGWRITPSSEDKGYNSDGGR